MRSCTTMQGLVPADLWLWLHRAGGRRLGLFLATVVLLFLGSGCASTQSARPRPPTGTSVAPATGVASYYARKFNGRKTASGERYNMHGMTAAHRTFPFGTAVRVTNLANNRVVVVKINDRGPFVRGRLIDVSYEAARRLDMVRTGTARVRVEPYGRADADTPAEFNVAQGGP